jgi:hypothetical protein
MDLTPIHNELFSFCKTNQKTYSRIVKRRRGEYHRSQFCIHCALSTPMKNVLSVLGLSAALAMAANLGVATSSSAQNSSPRYSRSPIQSGLAQAGGGTNQPASGSTITPSDQAKGSNLPSQYGVVRNVSGNTVEVRTLDGTSQTLNVPDSLAGTTGSLKRGDIIGYDVDKAGAVSRIEPPEVERAFEGTVSAIDEDQVTVTSATGETLTTTIRPSTIGRLGLTPGKQVTITQYKNTWATKVCCVEPPPAPLPVEPPVPQPPAGGVEQPVEEPVKGLW